MSKLITRVTGKKKVTTNIKNVESAIYDGSFNALSHSANLLRDKAIENLINLSAEPGLSADDQSITKKENWEIVKETNNRIQLQCKSNHAAIVEFGGMGKIIDSRQYGHMGFPIGKQQGFAISNPDGKGGPMIRRIVKLQRPKHYFGSAVNSEWVQQSMINRIQHNLWNSIKRVIIK